MAQGIPRIKEFPRDSRYWRVDWFGALEHDPSVATELKVQIVISPIKEEFLPLSKAPAKKLAGVSAVEEDQQRTIRIGVGQFPLVSIGSIWRNGLCQSEYAGTTFTFTNLQINAQTARVIPANHQVDDIALVGYKNYRYGGAGKNTKLVAVEYGGDPYGILIPALELVRFYYAVSTDLAHAVFGGSFQHDQSSLIHRNRCSYDPKEDRFYLGIRRDLTDEDGWVIARILNSKIAWRNAIVIYDQIVKQSINRDAINIASHFPFHGRTTLRARCKPMKSGGEWRKLVLALDYCSGEFPFSDLTIIRDNDGTKGNSETDLDDKDKKTIDYGGKKKKTNSEGKELQSGEEPNKAYSTEIISLPTSRFGAIEGKKADKPEKEFCEYIGRPLPFDNGGTNELGTGQGGYADTGVTQAKVQIKRNRQKGLPASFEAFTAAIEKLNENKEVTASIRTLEGDARFLPLIKPSGYAQWAYLDSSTLERRQIIVADIEYKDNHFCAIEVELRNSDRCRVALVSEKSGAYISSYILRQYLMAAAKNKCVWESALNAGRLRMSVVTLKHTWVSVAQFSEALERKLTKPKE